MNKRKLIFGLLMIALGLLFLSRSLGIFDFSMRDLWGTFFPLLLIGIGFYLIARKKRLESETAQYSDPVSPGPSPIYNESVSSKPRVSTAPEFQSHKKIKYHKGLGDMFINLDGISLASVEVSSFIGDVEIKIHGGKLSSGLNRIVVSGFIGDVRIHVPADMPVFVQASSFIGDVDLLGSRIDGFGNNLDAQTADYQTATDKLFIANNCFIGDIRVMQI